MVVEKTNTEENVLYDIETPRIVLEEIFPIGLQKHALAWYLALHNVKVLLIIKPLIDCYMSIRLNAA